VEKVIDPSEFASISRNSPYRAMTLPTSISDVFFRGRHVVRAGAVVEIGEVNSYD